MFDILTYIMAVKKAIRKITPSLDSKIDMPEGGSVGNVLKKTSDGVAWGSGGSGGGADWGEIGGTLSDQTDLNTELENKQSKIFEGDTPPVDAPIGSYWLDPNGVPIPGGEWGSITGTLADQTDLVAILDTKADKPTIKNAMDATAVSGAHYYLGVQTAVAAVLPSTANVGDEISIIFYSGSTAATLSITGTTIGEVVTPSANQRIEINMLWDGSYWSIITNVMDIPTNGT